MRQGWRTVFGGIPARLRAELPAELRSFRWNYSGIMAKASYGNRLLHYEIWVRPRLGLVELGLHFEADALTNARLYGAFRARSRDVKRALGATARIEEWDRGPSGSALVSSNTCARSSRSCATSCRATSSGRSRSSGRLGVLIPERRDEHDDEDRHREDRQRQQAVDEVLLDARLLVDLRMFFCGVSVLRHRG
ncbi:MAG: hypothetical protein AUH85_13475 [Chloroflexi bacterium 13_1_40CM_4_68_4]|nr:MAG: hypothetical protein AUH85_13475 [Chloroflexi bacterium 13_1_40CM_4_68_4]